MPTDDEALSVLLHRQRAYIPGTPHALQRRFLALPNREALYGGAAGGGKSWALLASALLYVDVPGYSALLLRRHYADLWQEGGLGDLARKWLTQTDARWVASETSWVWPSGARLRLGYVGDAQDILRYQGGEYQYIGWDELTQLRQRDYLYLMSRLRRSSSLQVPLRVRAATNPGGPGHEWVSARFVSPGYPARPYVPARATDNPHLDVRAYMASLSELDPITLRQLRDGDWTAASGGGMFARASIPIVPALPNLSGRRPVRSWDLAATDEAAATLRNSDPDYTVGMRMWALDDGCIYIDDVIRARCAPAEVESMIRDTAMADGARCRVRIPRDPGQAGVAQADWLSRCVIPRDVHLICESESGRKWERARPAAALAGSGRIRLVAAPWVAPLLAELEAFAESGDYSHDDQVDAMSGGVAILLPEMRRHTARAEPERDASTSGGEPEQWEQRRARQEVPTRAAQVRARGFFA